MKNLIVLFLIYCTATLSYSQTVISGIIKDENGTLLIGANVYIEGTYDGTSSNDKGFYTFTTYELGKQLLKVADESLKTAKMNLDIAEQKFESGAINSFNFRDVQVYYLNAANSKLEASYNLIDTNLELLRLTGVIITEFQE